MRVPTFGNPLARMPSAKLREINKRWKNGEFIKGLDPNFGYETKGASAQSISTSSGSNLLGCKFTLTETGTPSSITVYIHNSDDYARKIKCAIYDVASVDSYEKPVNLLCKTAERIVSAGFNGWQYNINFLTNPELSAANYFLVVWAEKTSLIGKYVDTYYDTGETKQMVSESYAYNNFPDPFPTPPSYHFYNRKVSIYCTYTAAGPTETIVAKNFPMSYLEKPVTAKQLTSRVEGATITHVAKDFPEALIKKGKAKELRSNWT